MHLVCWSPSPFTYQLFEWYLTALNQLLAINARSYAKRTMPNPHASCNKFPHTHHYRYKTVRSL